jgi:hypothetical protein
MTVERCDRCRKNSNELPARNKRFRELDRHGFDSWPRRLKVISSKYPGDEDAWSAVIGWQDPVAFDDILESNSAFARKIALPIDVRSAGNFGHASGVDLTFATHLAAGSLERDANVRIRPLEIDAGFA